MRNLKKLCAACVLTLVLALPAFAGDMLAGVASPPPPPPDTSSATTQGDMPGGITGEMGTGITGDMSAGVATTDPATDVLLSLLQSLLSLF
ncbi:MAG TPA: hypothetical protein VF791_15440 [Pyrinomonadaceae bacterium]